MKLGSAGFLSAVLYTASSLVVAGGFLGLTLVREYTWVTRLGGAAWVFLLSMIVLMPIITPMVKARLGE